MRTAAASTIALALLLVACGGGVTDAGPIGASDPVAEADAEPDTDDDGADASPEEVPEPRTDPPSQDPPEDDVPGGTSDPDGTTTVRLYFVAPGGGNAGRAGPFLTSVQREIPATRGIAQAALRELIAGPTGGDRALIDDLSTSVPADSLLLGVTIADGLATVDLSREFEAGGGSFSMFSRLAQVVYTTTQFPTVDEVAFRLDGQPVTVFSGEGIELDGPASRDDLLDLLPSVFVDTPAAGTEVAGGRLRMTGMAAVFEATFQYRLETADGTVLAEDFAMSTEGAGWGSFDVTIDYEVTGRQPATLTVWEYSAKDGSVQAERVTPLVLRP